MSKYTPEPWAFREREGPREVTLRRRHYEVGVNDGVGVAIVFGDDDANARRVCVCVNALAGIPTEALESGVVAELIHVVAQLTDQLERIGDHRKDAVFIEAGQEVLAKLKEST